MPRNRGTSRKGKPKKAERECGMGRALTKRRTVKNNPLKTHTGGMAARQHVVEADAYNVIPEPEENNKQSVLEQDAMTEFLSAAEMANKQYRSEKERFVVLDGQAQMLDTFGATNQHFFEAFDDDDDDDDDSYSDDVVADKPPINLDDFHFEELAVPRRPSWTREMSAAQLDAQEKESFLEWRRAIAAKEEELALSNESDDPKKKLLNNVVTPFEKNLQVWRQLWRVLESSSCIIQIIDARNPLFYISTDLRRYCNELSDTKPMLLVVNKSDYLTEKQRKIWYLHFKEKMDMECIFFSAFNEQKKLDEEKVDVDDDIVDGDEKCTEPQEIVRNGTIGIDEPLTRTELLNYITKYACDRKCEPNIKHNRLQFGMVGFPNVGKSSVINVLMGNRKYMHNQVRVGVASQPGKTKHFQTLLLPDRDDVMLCDCPGLVFPSFCNSKSDLIAAGVYPIEQMRDFWPVMELIVSRIPRQVLSAYYGVKLPTAKSWESGKHLSAEEFLTSYCISRSLYTASSGNPHFQQASRTVIRDYVEGKLLYCHPPPIIGEIESCSPGLSENNDIIRSLNAFEKETLLTALASCDKLRVKANVSMQQQAQQDGFSSRRTENNREEGSEYDGSLANDVEEMQIQDAIEDDLDILDFLENDNAGSSNTGGKRGKAHKQMKKWGKKGKKLRDKDPYGCHKNPDEMMDSEISYGAAVNAGKKRNQKKIVGYTRMINFAGARAATATSS